MPFALAIIGIVILASAIRGTSGTLFSTLKSDFTGSGNFLYWVLAILIVGSIGYIKKLQPLSVAFLALLMIVLFISNKGFFTAFQQGIGSNDSSVSCGAGGSTLSSVSNLFGTQVATQTAESQNNALATPGQSASTALSNSMQNLTNALNYGSGSGL
jgi:hypothetical protein